MSAVIIDGKKIAEEIKSELQSRIEALQTNGVKAGLAAILVGDSPASAVYINSKTRMCESLGLFSTTYRLDAGISQAALLELVAQLNEDSRIHGILVQLPLPDHINPQQVFEKVTPEKDVDGFNPINRGRLQVGEDAFAPCTPLGVQELILRSGVSPRGRNVVILGRSSIVGLPLALLLCQKNERADATVTICHSATGDLEKITRAADILVAAVGLPKFVTAEMVKAGAVVIDVGINRVPDASMKNGYRIVGDVDFEAVQQKAAAITPVPGGVGPMTIMMLMRNTVTAAERGAQRA